MHKYQLLVMLFSKEVVAYPVTPRNMEKPKIRCLVGLYQRLMNGLDLLRVC